MQLLQQLSTIVMQMRSYRKFSEIYTTLGIWATMIILRYDQREIWATLDLSPVAIARNMELAINLADTAARYFQKDGPP